MTIYELLIVGQTVQKQVHFILQCISSKIQGLPFNSSSDHCTGFFRCRNNVELKIKIARAARIGRAETLSAIVSKTKR